MHFAYIVCILVRISRDMDFMCSFIMLCCSAVDLPAIMPLCFSQMAYMSMDPPLMPPMSPIEPGEDDEPVAHPLMSPAKIKAPEITKNFEFVFKIITSKTTAMLRR